MENENEKIIQNGTIKVTHYKGDEYIMLWIIYDDNSHGIAFDHMSIFSRDDDIEKCKKEYCELDFSHNGGGLACHRIPIEELKNAYLQIDDFLNNKRKDIDILMKWYNSEGTQKYDAFYMKIKYENGEYILECDYDTPTGFWNEFGIEFPAVYIKYKDIEIIRQFFYLTYLILKNQLPINRIDEKLKIETKQ